MVSDGKDKQVGLRYRCIPVRGQESGRLVRFQIEPDVQCSHYKKTS